MNQTSFRIKILKGVCLILSVLLLAVTLWGCGGAAEKKDDDVTPTVPLKFDESDCSFFDKFTGDVVDTEKWDYQNGDGSAFNNPGWGNNEKQYYRSENARIEDNMLKIRAQVESYEGYKYTSAKLVTKGKFSQTYGRFEARIRLTKALPGLWPAFWMMPANSEYGGWPRSGEIDIMEMKGRLPHNVSSAVHYGGRTHRYRSEDYTYPDGLTVTDFHLYTLDWTADSLTFSVDGDPYHVLTKDMWYTETDQSSSTAPFDKDFFLILNLAVGGNFDGGRTPPDEDMPAEMEVDFVRVYALDKIPAYDGDTVE